MAGPLTVDTLTGLLADVVHRPSPNHDARPPDAAIELIVVHAISLPPHRFGGPWVDRLFRNRIDPRAHPSFTGLCGLEVSAHVLIRRTGRVIQYVPFHRRAWHAGASCYRGRERCNDFSVGIELEGSDARRFEPVQYCRLAALIRALRAAYPRIAPDAIVGHCDIAPGRKTDPGPRFDWDRLYSLLEAHD